jgi:hypothetical protein
MCLSDYSTPTGDGREKERGGGGGWEGGREGGRETDARGSESPQAKRVLSEAHRLPEYVASELVDLPTSAARSLVADDESCIHSCDATRSPILDIHDGGIIWRNYMKEEPLIATQRIIVEE